MPAAESATTCRINADRSKPATATMVQLPVRRLPERREMRVRHRIPAGRDRLGRVSLDGVRAVVAAKHPKAIHEGNGHVVLSIDEMASGEQAGALLSVVSGRIGGMPWEALAGTIERFDGPVRKPVEITIAGERSRVRVPGAIDLTPLGSCVGPGQGSPYRLPEGRILLERCGYGDDTGDARRAR